jgi:FkbM family methyltransferase
LKKRFFDFIRLIVKTLIPERLICNYTVGAPYGSLYTKLVPNHYQYKTESYRSFSRNDINYYLDISDLIGWYIYFGFKEKAKELLIELAEKDDVVLDIGANIGETSLRLAQKVQSNGKVFAFEPAQINYKQLQKTLSLNNLKHITAYPLGIGASEGKLTLYTIDQHNKGKNKIADNEPVGARNEAIELTTIDRFVQNHQLENVDLIKIDIEGYEMNALQGGQETLKKFRPKLFIEVDNQNLFEQEASAKELFNYLMAHNYELTKADKMQLLDLTLDYEDCHFDLIAIPLKNK